MEGRCTDPKLRDLEEGYREPWYQNSWEKSRTGCMLVDFVSGSGVPTYVRLPRNFHSNFCCTSRFVFLGMSDDVGLSQIGPTVLRVEGFKLQLCLFRAERGRLLSDRWRFHVQ
jgi:hypothetical protein